MMRDLIPPIAKGSATSCCKRATLPVPLHLSSYSIEELKSIFRMSDRGVQYASREYVEQLQEIGAQLSMSSVGNPYDNAKAESFFKTLKQEEVYLKEYDSFADAEQNLTVFIEQVYNIKRLHSSLGYLPPIEFEMAYAQGLRC